MGSRSERGIKKDKKRGEIRGNDSRGGGKEKIGRERRARNR